MKPRLAFTVFTATYNRAGTLQRVYDSLCAQTFHDFEWLVVDDGSTDHTCSLVEGWRVQAPFPIRYLYQANQHKKVAHNRGIREARGELFLTLDSDDTCKPEALERLWFHWQSIPETVRSGFSGVSVLCEDDNGQVVGSLFPAAPDGGWIDSDSVEIAFRYRVRGEKWGFHRTAVLRGFPFPQDGIAGLVPENVVWEKIAGHYQTRFVNEVLRTYHTGSDQITRVARPDQHALGHALACKSSLEHGARYFAYAPLPLLDVAMSLVRFNGHVRHQALMPVKVAGGLPRLLVALMTPPGWLRYWLDRYRMAHR